jgi:hypothetical protein
MLEERDGADDLDAEDLFDELGDDVLVAFDVEALLEVEVPLLVRPDCDVAGLVDARLEAVFPVPRLACDVEGRVPPLPAVLKLPLFILLFTRFEVFLLFLL